jgi:hypothetical protein
MQEQYNLCKNRSNCETKLKDKYCDNNIKTQYHNLSAVPQDLNRSPLKIRKSLINFTDGTF